MTTVEKIAKLEIIISDKDPKEVKRLVLNQFTNMLRRLSAEDIVEAASNNEDTQTFIRNAFDAVEELYNTNDTSRAGRKAYLKHYRNLQNHVKQVYDFDPVGSIQSTYMALGMAIGAGVGTALSTTMPAFLSIGIGAGMAIGIAIGNSKEKAAKEAGKIY